MIHISLLVPEEAVAASIVDPTTMFNGANGFLAAAGKEPLFALQLVGLTKQVRLNNGQFTVNTDAVLSDSSESDLVLIPAFGGDLKKTIAINKDFIPWIIDAHKKGAKIASLCVGSFLLASTGLLNGKECSSHWLTASLFREMFPEVTLADGRIVSEQDGLYSSGGATSYWNLLLYLVEKYAGREIAITAAKVFALEIDRNSQSPFIIFQGQKNHVDAPIKEAQEFIEKNITEKISVEDLAVMFAIGRRHFERRFKKATNNTPSEYIQRVEIEAAKKRFETSNSNVSEVMYEVGYSDLKSFRIAFKKITGLSPAEYRNKFNKAAAYA